MLRNFFAKMTHQSKPDLVTALVAGVSEMTACEINLFSSASVRTSDVGGWVTVSASNPELSWCQCYKTFYGCKLRLIAIRKSVCPWQAFPAWSNVF